MFRITQNTKIKDSRITNVPYGKEYADLAPFIKQLVEAADRITQPTSPYAIHRGIGKISRDYQANVVFEQETEARSLERLGDNAARKNDFIAAIDFYEKSLSVKYDIWLELKICQAQMDLGEAPEAINKLLALKKKHPSQLKIQLNLLVAYSKIADYEAMVTIATDIVRKKPTFVFAWDALFQAYDALKLYEEILKSRKIPLQLFPHSALINESVGLAFFQLDRLLEALGCYDIVLNEKPENRTALLGKLRTLAQLGGKNFNGVRELSRETYLEKALILSDQLKVIDGQNPEVWMQRSIIQKEQADYKNAKRSIKQAEGFDANPERILQLRAALLTRRERFSAAIGLLSEGIERYPHNSQLPYLRATTRFKKFRQSRKKIIPPIELQKIEQDYRSALELDPQNVSFLKNIIWFCESFQLNEQAEKHRQQLNQLNEAIDILCQ